MANSATIYVLWEESADFERVLIVFELRGSATHASICVWQSQNQMLQRG